MQEDNEKALKEKMNALDFDQNSLLENAWYDPYPLLHASDIFSMSSKSISNQVSLIQ
jgi:hypothetical protein